MQSVYDDFPASYAAYRRMLTWVVRMSWSPLLVSILFPQVAFFRHVLDRGHHPYISTGFGGNHFSSTLVN